MVKKILRRFLIVLLVFAVLVIGLVVALRFPSVQTYIAQRFTAILSKSLNTKVSIDRVEITFFNKADLINFYLEDHDKDTLISAKELKINFRVFDLFKKQISVSKVYLDGAKVHIHRDLQGKTNITELFKSFSSNKPQEETVKSKFTWDMDLKDLELRQTDFRYLDEKGNVDVKVYVPTLTIAMNDVNLEKKLIDISKARIDGTQVAIDLLKHAPTPGDDSIMHVHFMVGDMKVKFADFALTQTRFQLTDHNHDTILPRGMDFKHLDVSDINLNCINGTIVADSVITEITRLTAKERSGFELKSLTAKARVSTNDITLAELDLKTPNSEIKDYLSLRFNAYHDFKDFVKAMRLQANFSNTKLSLKDLNYFVHQLDKAEHNHIFISGAIDGKISNLKGKGIEIRGGSNTIFKGDFSTSGLPNINETSINLRVNRLATTADDVQRFYPGVKLPPNLDNLGLIYYTGSLDGFVTDFVSTGKVVTSIGTATTDVNFKYDKKSNKASYKGALALNEFDLGKYFNDETNLGKVSLNGKIDGGGLTMESLHANLEGNISSITLKGYNYKDIQVNGYIVRKSFNGLMQIHDEFLDMDFNGRADLSKEIPEFRFDADIRNIALKNLNLAKQDFRFTGKMKSDFRGVKVDDIVGSLSLNDFTIARDTVSGHIKFLKLEAKILPSAEREFKLASDFAEGEMKGNFTIKELPKALLAFTKYTFFNERSDTTVIAPQNFTADLIIYEPGNLTRILYPDFYLIRNSRISGDFNSVDHAANLNATIPQLRFAGYDARRIDIKSHFAKGDIDFRTVIDKVYSADSVVTDTLAIAIKSQENKDIRFDVMVADKKRYNYANVTAFLTPFVGKAALRLEPSDVKLGNYNWHFLPDNLILVEGKKITTNNLVFKTYDQTIYINSYLKHDTSTSIKITLDNTDIGDFTGIFTQKMKDLKGAMNGKLVVEDIFNKPKVFADLVVNEFTLGNQLIGDINVESNLDDAGKKINVYASIKSINNFLEARGYVSVDPLHPGLDIDIDAPRLGLNFLNYKFFEKYVKDCRGYARIDANVHGTLKKPLLSGDVYLKNDTVTISFLNTTYHIGDLDAKLDDHGFDFGEEFQLYDVNNNPIFASGRINHESFRKFALHLDVHTPKAQFINTNAKISPNFYGVAYGSGRVSFRGNISSPDITAVVTTSAGTHCNIPTSASYETNRYGFYRFTDPNAEHGKIRIVQSPQLKLNGVHFNLMLTATPEARMDIILDPLSGDILTTYGTGDLIIDIPRVGGTTIRGDYTINRGNYLFTLQRVVNKPFELSPGGIIRFNGDIYKAGIDIDAVYDVRASVADLFDPTEVSQLGTVASSAIRQRVRVRLYMSLTGILEKPNITFSIQATELDPVIKSYVEQKLNLLKSNESEMFKQVFGILVMNRLLPTGNTGDVLGRGNYASAAAANTVSEFLSSQFSNYLGNLFDYSGNNDLKNLDIRLGFKQYDQFNTGTIDVNGPVDTRRELNLALQQRLLNNRLTINAGGNLDFGASTNDPGKTSNSVIPTGDFQVQYALTPDGVWSVKGFNRTNYDYYNSRNTNRTGIGIAYRQEFDTPAELFRNMKKKPKEDKQKISTPPLIPKE